MKISLQSVRANYLYIHQIFFFFLFSFWPRSRACEILVPQPGMGPRPLAVKAQSPNHLTTREFLSTKYSIK